MLRGRRIVLGVSGGVAAYKSVEICRRLVDAGAYVQPVMTQSATRFIGPATFAAVASEPPRLDLWDAPEPSPHTTLGQGADLVLVAPATARMIASYAHGLSDDLLTTTLLATRAPVVVCPAMHTEMWEHPAVADNISLLRSRGVIIVDPANGHLAGGDQGVGRLADLADILAAVETVLSHGGDLSGRTVLVTAGGTREPIDPVRYLGNRSSGKQGHALAEVARARGAHVVLVTASSLPAPAGVETVRVETAQEMFEAVMARLDEADIAVMAAAVADFRPEAAAEAKIKKAHGPPEVRLVPTADILAAVAERRDPKRVVVGFAAETDDLEANALEKLRSKGADLVVANDVSAPDAGFEHETNRVVILGPDAERTETGLVTKLQVARAVLDRAVELLDKRGRQG